ncbi:MAG: 23S rRNA (pseudouridine(1915)-N(3))-methyltransferase RlmH [Chitinophagaceae bacterium]|nr:23S rRNA (pseudouridine(1915)-N(3))-methyltransferase RlmH [Chitinophagaceae bacterium]
MKIQFWAIGKANEPYVNAGVEEFTNRVDKYFKTAWTILPVPKNAGQMSEVELRRKEAEMILQGLAKDDYLVALDENGKQVTSVKLAAFLQARANESVKKIVFLIGGAYGLDESVLTRANYTWSLSSLTFPHQIVRLLLAEQVYRASTILRNEKYHHQ